MSSFFFRYLEIIIFLLSKILQLFASTSPLPTKNLHRHQIRISSSATGKKTPIRGIGFHLSSFASFIFRLALNHQAEGTSTWLIIGSNSHASQANNFCYEYICHAFMVAYAVLPCRNNSPELLLSLNLLLTHIQYHVFFFFYIFFYIFC